MPSNVVDVLECLGEADLQTVEGEIQRLVRQRMKGTSLIALEHMSTLELRGLLAMIRLKLRGEPLPKVTAAGRGR